MKIPSSIREISNTDSIDPPPPGRGRNQLFPLPFYCPRAPLQGACEESGKQCIMNSKLNANNDDDDDEFNFYFSCEQFN